MFEKIELPCRDHDREEYLTHRYRNYGTRLRLTKPKKSLNDIREKRMQKKLARKKGRK